jgi:hypothetical protein
MEVDRRPLTFPDERINLPGGTLAPGGVGTTGKTVISGNYLVNSGTSVALSDYQPDPNAVPEIACSPQSIGPPQLRRFSFTRLHSELTYIVEISDNLNQWDTLDTNPGNVGETVTVEPPTNGACRFLRLRVVKSP